MFLKKLKTFLLVILTVFTFGVFSLPQVAQAQPTQGLINCQSALPGTDIATGELPACDFCQAIKLIDSVMNVAAGFLVGATVLMIIVAGIMYITAAGSPTRTEQAKKTLQFAIIGLVIAILAFVIVGTILNILQPGNTLFGEFECSSDTIIPGTP